ncbi:putative HIT finger domain protein [Aspergillus fijiensis CBS 313.89]|uniref:Uncharacterized protein n=1 Tax=Aspergillus fijiensis CBS 313.89 TaxID=1448319 RepID=A0A8G1VUE8_9EURO|nr:uncharacterized protein BO72DRAFT_251573 [Aspergillus fijiensis CBS 313.89]RAK73022.1 hypothetical protein BO72DRAFT_251573 [Aspergillus fijiensis CBS 313.89]
MYRVELLPGSTTHVTPGWTYVPDRGFDPAKAAITPTIGRKRGIRDPGRTDLSSRQTNAIIRHLAELDRENHRDVQIQIPVRQKEPAAPRGTSPLPPLLNTKAEQFAVRCTATARLRHLVHNPQSKTPLSDHSPEQLKTYLNHDQEPARR